MDNKYTYVPGVVCKDEKFLFFLWRRTYDEEGNVITVSSFDGTKWVDKTERFVDAEFIEIDSGAMDNLRRCIDRIDGI